MGQGQRGQAMEGMDEPWGSKPRGNLEQGSGIFREGRSGRGVSEETGSPVSAGRPVAVANGQGGRGADPGRWSWYPNPYRALCRECRPGWGEV